MKKYIICITCLLITTTLLAQSTILIISQKTWDWTDQLSSKGPVRNNVFKITRDSVSNEIYVNDSLVSKNVVKNDPASFTSDILKYDVFFWEDFEYQSRIATQRCDTVSFGISIGYTKDLVTKNFYLTNGCSLPKYYPLFTQLFDLFKKDRGQ